MNTTDFDTLMSQLNAPKAKTPAWLRKAAKNVGYCAKCHTQYGKAELNANKHCRHCADELNEAHLLNGVR